jgi:hypothetical protein
MNGAATIAAPWPAFASMKKTQKWNETVRRSSAIPGLACRRPATASGSELESLMALEMDLANALKQQYFRPAVSKKMFHNDPLRYKLSLAVSMVKFWASYWDSGRFNP